jgi:hypothetical protein
VCRVRAKVRVRVRVRVRVVVRVGVRVVVRVMVRAVLRVRDIYGLGLWFMTRVRNSKNITHICLES